MAEYLGIKIFKFEQIWLGNVQRASMCINSSGFKYTSEVLHMRDFTYIVKI